ncbi:hypothetical protein MCC02031_19100 [Bifidobacteriaceae bacterium MCC02031]|nr:hypothetical protein MCC02031_19100 [Bifidobacteriaceae bacterium MCC02031]
MGLQGLVEAAGAGRSCTIRYCGTLCESCSAILIELTSDICSQSEKEKTRLAENGVLGKSCFRQDVGERGAFTHYVRGKTSGDREDGALEILATAGMADE